MKKVRLLNSEFDLKENIVIDANVLWEHIIKDLETCMTTPIFVMAIKPLGVRSFEKGILTLVTNNPVWNNAIKKNMQMKYQI